MKLKSQPETENEKLDDVTFEQAKGLKDLGFDWNCGSAYDEYGNSVNWTTKRFFCWKPTVALALRFLRKRYGMFHSLYIRSFDKNLFGFSVSHGMIHQDLYNCDFTEKGDEEEDGIVSFDYDEAESVALNYAIRYLLKDISRDFSWLKQSGNAYMGVHMFVPGKGGQLTAVKYKVGKVDMKLRIARISNKEDGFWISFHKLYSTPEEAMASEK